MTLLYYSIHTTVYHSTLHTTVYYSIYDYIKMRAFLFDVFGTVVNWRPTVSHALYTTGQHALANPQTSPPTRAQLASMTMADWNVVAADWRASYMQFTKNYSLSHPDQQPGSDHPPGLFVTVDQHHYDALPGILAKHGLAEILPDDEAARWDLVYVWHRLPPWPDSVQGLERLNNGHQDNHTSTLSNGNTSLLRDLASFGALPFRGILSAEDFGAYKPSSTVYQGAAQRLGVAPGQCVMVAAHLGDLKAAKKEGFRTVYVEREGEDTADERAEVEVDEVVTELTSISLSVSLI